jgi:hypothetical protein
MYDILHARLQGEDFSNLTLPESRLLSTPWNLNPIEQVFAKLKHLLRTAAERTLEATWKRIGKLLNEFSNAPTTSSTQVMRQLRVIML